MAEKTMTQVKALEFAVDRMREIEGDWAELDEAIAVIEGMVAKRKAPRKPRVNKEAIAFAERVWECLNGAEEQAALTNGEVAAALSNGAEKGEEGYVSFQKVAAAMRRLKEEGRVEEIPGEKAKDKKTYKAL